MIKALFDMQSIPCDALHISLLSYHKLNDKNNRKSSFCFSFCSIRGAKKSIAKLAVNDRLEPL
jgi:hypothetical protein